MAEIFSVAKLKLMAIILASMQQFVLFLNIVGQKYRNLSDFYDEILFEQGRSPGSAHIKLNYLSVKIFDLVFI